MQKCTSCQVEKAKQKAVPKLSTHIPSTIDDQRLFLDLSRINKPIDMKHTRKKNLCMIVDDNSKVKSSSFHDTKDRMIDPTHICLRKWRAMGLPIENVRCDKYGEGKKIEETINGEKWKLNINFEHTARAPLQQNSLVKTGFAIVLHK